MPESEPNDESTGAEASPLRPRRRSLTPAERRLLGTPRAGSSEPAPTSQDEPEEPSLPEAEAPTAAQVREERLPSAKVRAQAKASRAIELSQALIVLGALVFLLVAFFAGRKFDAIKYHIMSRVKAQELAAAPDKFPGVSTQELIETGLAAAKRNEWQEATDRLLSAKRKDRTIPGILFHIGKGSYERGDLAGADMAFGQAIRFGENLAASHFYRGIIALQRRDLPAAIRYFEAATNAEPFVAQFYYFWGDALRINFNSRAAMERYAQAAQRAPSPAETALCQFKIRLARIEVGEVKEVAAELEGARQTGPLSIDWLMTDAALALQSGRIPEAARLISEAREKSPPGMFPGFASDIFFRRAGENHPEIATLVAPPAGLRPDASVPFAR